MSDAVFVPVARWFEVYAYPSIYNKNAAFELMELESGGEWPAWLRFTAIPGMWIETDEDGEGKTAYFAVQQVDAPMSASWSGQGHNNNSDSKSFVGVFNLDSPSVKTDVAEMAQYTLLALAK